MFRNISYKSLIKTITILYILNKCLNILSTSITRHNITLRLNKIDLARLGLRR